jgi:7-keto-8-aminopelargonate synthetase-like enzyme
LNAPKQRALDDVVLENTLGEACRTVGAFVVGDEKLADDIVDSERTVPHLASRLAAYYCCRDRDEGRFSST